MHSIATLFTFIFLSLSLGAAPLEDCRLGEDNSIKCAREPNLICLTVNDDVLCNDAEVFCKTDKEENIPMCTRAKANAVMNYLRIFKTITEKANCAKPKTRAANGSGRGPSGIKVSKSDRP